MEFSQGYVDILRAVHLICFAAGMGAGLYLDFRTFKSFGEPLAIAEIRTLEQIHAWIAFAFAGLWITGIALIYVRTAFDLAAFSPKLWLKITLMTLMVLNSQLIARVVIPVLRRNIGRSMASLPIGKLMRLSQVAIMSLFGWTMGLILGSSVVLKTAPWEVLLPLTIGGFAVLTIVGQLAVIVMCNSRWVKVEAEHQ